MSQLTTFDRSSMDHVALAIELAINNNSRITKSYPDKPTTPGFCWFVGWLMVDQPSL